MSFFKKTSVKICVREVEFSIFPLSIGDYKKVMELSNSLIKDSEDPTKSLDNIDKMLDVIISQIDYSSEAPTKEDLKLLTVPEIKQIFNAVNGNVTGE
jgi:hypothetical protein